MRTFLFLLIILLPAYAIGQGAMPMSATADSLQQINHTFSVMDSVQLKVACSLDSLKGQINKVQASLDNIYQFDGGAGKGKDSLRQVLINGELLQEKLLAKQHYLAQPLEKTAGIQQHLQGADISIVALSQVHQAEMDLPQIQAPKVNFKVFNSTTDVQGVARANSINDFQIPALYSLRPDSSSFSNENIDKNIEAQLLKQNDMAALSQQTGLGEDPLKNYLKLDAKTLVQEQSDDISLSDMPMRGIAGDLPIDTDHFAGKEEALQKARIELSRYKERFSELKSIKELPENPLKRHPLHDVKWYKRLELGLQWQLGQSDAFRIDLGPRLSYLLTDKLTLGMVYQQRFSISKKLSSFVSFEHDQVFGYSLFGSYAVKKGFYGQFSYERLSTLAFQMPGQQEINEERLWVEGFRLGLGKSYTIYKKLRGYSLMEYNFSKTIHNPYRQQLQLKMGITWSKM